jgi:thymidylate kinase
MVIVSIDGIDAAGKTTLAKLLVENSNLNFVVVESSRRKDLFPEVREYLNQNIKDNIIARFLYFSFASLLASNEAIEHTNAGKNVILDRSFYSTIAHHRAFDRYYCNGEHLKIIDELSKAIEKRMVKPDVAVFLYIDEKERVKRLQIRDDSQNNKLDEENTAQAYAQEEFHNIAARLKEENIVKVVEIDTTYLNKQEVAKIVENYIKNIVLEKTASWNKAAFRV